MFQNQISVLINLFVDLFHLFRSRPSGAVSGGYTGTDNYLPISGLNPYQSRWTIKARATNKGEIRRWTNARGEGKLFSFDLLDARGGEIRGETNKPQTNINKNYKYHLYMYSQVFICSCFLLYFA
jgi:hypothetical protein